MTSSENCLGSDPGDQAPMANLTFQDVLDILRLVDAGPFSDFQIDYQGTNLKVTRQTAAVVAAPAMPVVPVVTVVPAKPPAGVAPAAASMPTRPIPVENGVAVKPPMAGTFYATPAPGAAPFVEVDRVVRKGEQLGIVEVMKLFTPVLSPCEGTVRAILVGNEEFVQSDQTLMVIEAA